MYGLDAELSVTLTASATNWNAQVSVVYMTKHARAARKEMIKKTTEIAKSSSSASVRQVIMKHPDQELFQFEQSARVSFVNQLFLIYYSSKVAQF